MPQTEPLRGLSSFSEVDLHRYGFMGWGFRPWGRGRLHRQGQSFLVAHVAHEVVSANVHRQNIGDVLRH